MAVKCPTCQTDNRDGSVFCKKCGGRLELKCPSCGSPCEQDSVFCNKCGHNLKAADPVARVDYSKPQTYTPKFLAEKIPSTGKSMEGSHLP